MKNDAPSRDEEEARRLLPPASLPGGLAPTGELVQGIRRRMDRRAVRRHRWIGIAGGAAACAALAVAAVLFAARARCQCGKEGCACNAPRREGASAAGPCGLARAQCEEEAFLAYDRAFGTDPNAEAFEALDDLILALDYDFSSPDWQSL